MTDRQRIVLFVIAVVLLLAWATLTVVSLWTGDHRWAGTGFVLMVLAAVAAYISWTAK